MNNAHRSRILATVDRLAKYARQGDIARAGEERRTLNDLDAGWRLGTLSYSRETVAALEAAGLDTTP